MKCEQDLIILSRCQLYIKTPFKLQPEDGNMLLLCYLINYILYNKVVLDYKIVYFH